SWTIARSFQSPTADATGAAIYQNIQGERSFLQPRELFNPFGGFDLSFEIDFWGRYRRATEAARAELLGSFDARRFVLSTLVTDLASGYMRLRSLDSELDVSRATLAAREDSLKLVTLREQG